VILPARATILSDLALSPMDRHAGGTIANVAETVALVALHYRTFFRSWDTTGRLSWRGDASGCGRAYPCAGLV